MRERAAMRGALGALLLATLLTSGCASTLKLEAPHLSVISMNVVSADIFSQRMLVRMRVLNPNARELQNS